MTRPPVLFLDEPTTGLDISSRGELWEMIRELVSEGTTVLLTTQYLEEADRLAERIAVVDGGRVIANDTPERLKAQLGNTVIQMDIRGDGRAELAASALAGLPSGRVEREGQTLRITSDRGAHLLIEILRSLDSRGLEPERLAVRERSIDDVFLALTGRHAEHATGSGEAKPATGRRWRR